MPRPPIPPEAVDAVAIEQYWQRCEVRLETLDNCVHRGSLQAEARPLVEAAQPAIEDQAAAAAVGRLLPHSKTVGHLNSIATLLEGVGSASGVPIETQRDVDFLRELAAAIAASEGGEKP